MRKHCELPERECAAAMDGLVFMEIHTGRLDCPESLGWTGWSMAKASQFD